MLNDIDRIKIEWPRIQAITSIDGVIDSMTVDELASFCSSSVTVYRNNSDGGYYIPIYQFPYELIRNSIPYWVKAEYNKLVTKFGADKANIIFVKDSNVIRTKLYNTIQFAFKVFECDVMKITFAVDENYDRNFYDTSDSFPNLIYSTMDEYYRIIRVYKDLLTNTILIARKDE